jgi:hypothetical protein
MSIAKKGFYVLAAAAVAFTILMAFSPVGAALAPSVVAIPGVAGLTGALLMIFRDALNADREDLRELRRSNLEIGFKSDAAAAIFNKQAAFAEDYAIAVIEVVGELFADGPSRKGFSHYQRLQAVREKHAPWVTPNILECVAPFEQRLWDMAKECSAMEASSGDKRMEHYHKSEELWSSFFGFPSARKPDAANKGDEALKTLGKDNVMAGLQKALGIDSINLLRAAFLK